MNVYPDCITSSSKLANIIANIDCYSAGIHALIQDSKRTDGETDIDPSRDFHMGESVSLSINIPWATPCSCNLLLIAHIKM